SRTRANRPLGALSARSAGSANCRSSTHRAHWSRGAPATLHLRRSRRLVVAIRRAQVTSVSPAETPAGPYELPAVGMLFSGERWVSQRSDETERSPTGLATLGLARASP